MRKIILLVLFLFAFILQTSARADDISELKQQLAEQQKSMQQMQQRLDQLEASRENQDKQINEKISQMVEARQAEAVPKSLEWATRLKWSGDLRYRHETTDDSTASQQRDQHRIRARLKLEANINDEWDAVLRLASGSSDSPTSTNQTLGDSASDSFSSKEIWLDWAYASYHPKWKPGLNILLGKMGNPFYTVGGNQLIFDGDLSPEGGAAIYKWNLSEKTSAQLTGGGFWMRERSTDVDTSIFGIQGLLKHKLSDDRHILGGVSYYDFGNIKGQTLSGISAKGNSTTGGVYDNDYNILEGFGEYGFKLAKLPTAVYGSYVKNIGASSSEDTAWLIGCKFNKAKDPGSWELSYNYRDVEKDAVVGGICDSDFIGGGTNGSGHVFGFAYQLSKNVQLGLNYFMNKKNATTTEDNFRMLQADFVFKF